MTGTKLPVRLGEGLTSSVDVAAEHAKQDRLIAEIEASALPDRCVDQAMRTLAELRGSPVPWLATRYLQAVLTRGEAMFAGGAGGDQLRLGDEEPSLLCGCGTSTPVRDREKVRGRWMVYARCAGCGADLAAAESTHVPL